MVLATSFIFLRLFIHLLFLVVVGGQIAIGTQVLFLSPVTACIFTVFLLNNILMIMTIACYFTLNLSLFF